MGSVRRRVVALAAFAGVAAAAGFGLRTGVPRHGNEPAADGAPVAVPGERPPELADTPASAAPTALASRPRHSGGSPAPTPGSDARVETQGATGPLRGRITNRRGEAVAGARVTVTRLRGAEGIGPWTVHAETDGAGRYLVEGLANDIHEVRVEAPGYSPTVVHDTAAGSDRDFVLRTYVSAVLRVVDPDGGLVVGARVEARAVETGPGWGRYDTTDTDGLAELRGVYADEPYRLRVSPPDAREDLASVDVPAWVPRDGVVRLARSTFVEGRIVDASGAIAPGTAVLWRTERSPWTPVAAPEGRFRVAVPAGSLVELVARPFDAIVPDSADLTVTARSGDRDLVLPYSAGAVLTLRIEDAAEFANSLATLWDVNLRAEVRRRTVQPTLRFDGLDASRTYALWIAHMLDAPARSRGGNGRRGFFATGLVPGAGTVAVSAAPTGRLDGKVRGVADAKGGRVDVLVAGFLPFSGGFAKDGAFTLDGLPAGPVVVTAEVTANGRRHAGRAEATVPGHVDVHLVDVGPADAPEQSLTAPR